MASTQRLKEYEDLFKKSQAYNPATFAQDFERAYGEATQYNKDLIQDRSSAIGEMQAMPGQMREQYYSSPIRNPLAQEALIGQRKGTVSSNINTLTDLLTARKGRYQDVLGSHLQAYQADMENAQRAAENAWRLYQDALAREEAAKGGGGTGGMSVEDILNLLYGGGAGGGGNQPPPPPPEPKKKNWGEQFMKGAGATYDTSKWLGRDFLGLPSALGTFTNLLGNYMGNTWVPKKKDQSFLDKLFNR